MAIWRYGYIKTYMEGINHLELACRYMDQGNKVMANEELKKSMSDFQKLDMQAKLSEY